MALLYSAGIQFWWFSSISRIVSGA